MLFKVFKKTKIYIYILVFLGVFCGLSFRVCFVSGDSVFPGLVFLVGLTTAPVFFFSLGFLSFWNF